MSSVGTPASDPTTGSDVAARLEARIGRFMVWGVYAAMTLIVVGIVLAGINGIDPLDHALEPALDPLGIIRAMLALQPEGYLWAGIVLIIAIPIGRVVVAGIGFLATGERRFAVISLLVLGVVLISIIAAVGMEA